MGEKICPFMSWRVNTIAGSEDGIVYCYEEDCAMWDSEKRQCRMKFCF